MLQARFHIFMDELRIEKRPHNTGFASGGVTFELGALRFVSSLVLVESFILRNR